MLQRKNCGLFSESFRMFHIASIFRTGLTKAWDLASKNLKSAQVNTLSQLQPSTCISSCCLTGYIYQTDVMKRNFNDLNWYLLQSLIGLRICDFVKIGRLVSFRELENDFIVPSRSNCIYCMAWLGIIRSFFPCFKVEYSYVSNVW